MERGALLGGREARGIGRMLANALTLLFGGKCRGWGGGVCAGARETANGAAAVSIMGLRVQPITLRRAVIWYVTTV
jgi:hypothetical protein